MAAIHQRQKADASHQNVLHASERGAEMERKVLLLVLCCDLNLRNS